MHEFSQAANQLATARFFRMPRWSERTPPAHRYPPCDHRRRHLALHHAVNHRRHPSARGGSLALSYATSDFRGMSLRRKALEVPIHLCKVSIRKQLDARDAVCRPVCCCHCCCWVRRAPNVGQSWPRRGLCRGERFSWRDGRTDFCRSSFANRALSKREPVSVRNTVKGLLNRGLQRADAHGVCAAAAERLGQSGEPNGGVHMVVAGREAFVPLKRRWAAAVSVHPDLVAVRDVKKGVA
jgi:hypothetical protein